MAGDNKSEVDIIKNILYTSVYGTISCTWVYILYTSVYGTILGSN